MAFPKRPLPKGSMYDMSTYMWLFFMVNVGKYTRHGSYVFFNNQQFQGTLIQMVGWTYRVWIKQQNWHTLLSLRIFGSYATPWSWRTFFRGCHLWKFTSCSSQMTQTMAQPSKKPEQKWEDSWKMPEHLPKWSKKYTEPNPKKSKLFIYTRSCVTNKIFPYYMRISPWRLSLFQSNKCWIETQGKKAPFIPSVENASYPTCRAGKSCLIFRNTPLGDPFES